MTLVPISDFNELAILDCMRIPQIKCERVGKRYYGFFDKKKAEKVVAAYNAGTLKVVARDFAISMRSTKDRIFDNERREMFKADTVSKY